MPSEPNKQKSERKQGPERFFPRGERGVVCYRVEVPSRTPRVVSRRVREDRHITKRELAQVAARLEQETD